MDRTLTKAYMLNKQINQDLEYSNVFVSLVVAPMTGGRCKYVYAQSKSYFILETKCLFVLSVKIHPLKT